MNVKEQAVREKLREVVDPELGRPIADRNLIDEVRIDGETATVVYHLTVPFCPHVFATHVGKDIRKRVLEAEGVRNVIVRARDHIQTEEMNRELEKE